MDNYVCEFNSKKTGGFACTAKLRVKTSKALGDEFPIVVERSAADHDHQQDGVDKSERKYISYTKKMDNDIEDGILDGLPFQQIKKKIFKTFPDAVNDFQGTKRIRRLYSKFYR